MRMSGQENQMFYSEFVQGGAKFEDDYEGRLQAALYQDQLSILTWADEGASGVLKEIKVQS